MKGENLRNRLKTIEIDGEKIILADLAKRLKITPQALDSKLKAKRIDDEFVDEIVDALGIDRELLTGNVVKENGVKYGGQKKSLEQNVEESIELVDDVLSPEKVKDMTDEEIELFSAHRLSLLKLAKVLAKRKKPGSQ